MKSNWHVESADESIVEALSRKLNIPRLLATALVARGHDTEEDASRFLHPDLDRDWNDPMVIPGLPEAVDALEAAVRQGKRTVIFGDFDVDGITATSVMMLGLRACGLEAAPFIPRRQDEGYGLSREAIDRIMGIAPDDAGADGDSAGEPAAADEPACGFVPELVVTVDCGITCAPEVDYLRSLGVEVVVTDHHNASDLVPQGVPVCNPKLDLGNPSFALAGVGVALKVVQVLCARFGKPGIWKGLVDLAALGTVADRMPLVGENRALVKTGIEMIRESPRPGIAASLACAESNIQNATSTSLSFTIIPRLNAAGRMTDAMEALDLVLCGDPVEAQGLAKRLEQINVQRRDAEMELTNSALELAKTQYSGGRVMVLASDGWHEGVKGIVASRLANRFGVPTILFSIEGELAQGSARSVGSIDLYEAISQVEDLTVKFGGHKFAAGVTVKADDVDEFRGRLESYFDGLPDEDFEGSLQIDGMLGFDDLGMREVESLEMLEPFGQDNEEPLFAMRRVFMEHARAVGAEKNHLSFSVTNGVQEASAIYFRCADLQNYVSYNSPVDLVFVAQIDEWRGRKQLKLRVKDMQQAPAEPVVEDESAGNFVEQLYSEAQAHGDAAIGRHPVNLAVEAAAQCASASAAGGAGADSNCGMGAGATAAAGTAAASADSASPEAGRTIDELAAALTGCDDIRLHQSQREAIEALCRGENTLAVLATGRGKSLIFYIYAAMLARQRGLRSIFVYPLRALINDQAFHVGQNFAKLGIAVKVLTGETDQESREQIYRQWDSGEVPVILTTPEFLYAHRARLAGAAPAAGAVAGTGSAAAGEVGFIAIDEAHHIGTSSVAHRPVYSKLGFLKEAFPHATILAATATAPAEVASSIQRELAIQHVVVDAARRDNLRIDDKRGIADRQTYMASIVATGEKSVIYVNSRESSIELARMLRKRLPDQAMQVAFYNGALSRDVRLQIEHLFRQGDIRTVVATSAFGEGVNVPDVRHIVLYHMPLSRLAYNQMAGRCGRDGRPAYIHLLFDSSDIGVNRRILERYCPPREELVLLYKVARAFDDEHGHPASGDELAGACNVAGAGANMTMASVAAGMQIFAELGIAEVSGNELDRRYSVPATSARVDIVSSVSYQEARENLAAFDGFAQWLLEESSEVLLAGINKPLVPE